MPDFSEAFLQEQLNPIFLDVFQNMWQEVESSQVSEELKNETQLNLSRFLFRRLFQPLYLRYPPDISGSVFFIARIHEDGLGDLIALLKSAKVLKESRPLLDVQVVYECKKELPNIDLEDFSLQEAQVHSFFRSDEFSVLESVLEEKDDSWMDAKLFKLLQESELQENEQKALKDKWGYVISSLLEISDEANKEINVLKEYLKQREKAKFLYSNMKQSLAVVHIALALNTFDNPYLGSKSMYFAEAGNFPGIGNYLKRKWFGMGLQPFEEGIFTKKTLSRNTQLEDQWLPQLLWGNFNPSPAAIDDYTIRYSLHLGYFSRSRIQQQIFIYLICLSQKADSRNIDVVLSKTQLAHFPSLNYDYLLTLGITKVVLADPLKGEVELWVCNPGACNSESNLSRVLRLICVLPIPRDDFQKLTSMSGKVMGCTGDGSLSDCFAYDKIPFYELRSHKLETWKAIQAIAQFLQLKAVNQYLQQLSNFLKEKPEEIAQRLHHSLQEGAFQQEWTSLINFIRKYYCFDDALKSHLNRHFYTMKDPGSLKNEETLIQKYFSGKLSAQKAYAEIENVISRRLK